MRAGWLLPTLLAAGVLVGCATGRPSDSEIQALVELEADAAGDDPLFALQHFRRIDGRDAGDGRYVAAVSYMLVYRKSSDEVRLAAEEQADQRDGTDLASVLAAAFGGLTRSFRTFERGETQEFEREVTLERWESGWKLVPSAD